MSRSMTFVALAVVFAATGGTASAQSAPPAGQFGQRAGNSYVPSTNDPGCGGILCNPLPSSAAAGGTARNPSEVAPPPPCQGVLCGLTPYGMQRPYTAAEAADIERQRAAAQAQAAAAPPPEPAAPTHHKRRHRKAVAKAAKPARAAPAAAAARTPAPATADDVQSLR